ncbi:MAG: GrpB family protein [Proteobacteria bacterium]|nr:GrpB family protein [Pseudomonadota bacterium]
MTRIEKYNEHWRQSFELEKSAILKIAAQWIEKIEQVGSTAVPNLPAKPTIDICVGVNSLEIADSHIVNTLITQLGYIYLPELETTIPERRYLQKLDVNGDHLVHIHIVKIDEHLWNEYINFRDYLIANPEVTNNYADLKIKLKNQFGHDRKLYTAGKAKFIQEALKNINQEHSSKGSYKK